jgi:hypothetical protein
MFVSTCDQRIDCRIDIDELSVQPVRLWITSGHVELRSTEGMMEELSMHLRGYVGLG